MSFLFRFVVLWLFFRLFLFSFLFFSPVCFPVQQTTNRIGNRVQCCFLFVNMVGARIQQLQQQYQFPHVCMFVRQRKNQTKNRQKHQSFQDSRRPHSTSSYLLLLMPLSPCLTTIRQQMRPRQRKKKNTHTHINSWRLRGEDIKEWTSKNNSKQKHRK